MTFRDTCRWIRLDYRRYVATGRGEGRWYSILMLTQGLWASFEYRLAHWAYTSIRLKWLAWIAHAVSAMAGKIIEVLTGIRLAPGSTIGKGLYIGHFGPVVVNHRVRMGENCNLSQGVTIGPVQSGPRAGAPIVGNRVYIGPNAILIGNIEIGDDVAVGAGAVVVKSVPARAVVVGNPARVVSYKGSFDLVSYDGMEEDPSRLESRSFGPESMDLNP